MGLLRTGVALTFTSAVACYTPELRDCTLTCSSEADCATGQICGSDRLCAAPEIAGRCGQLPGDAGPQLTDAGVRDAKMPDAPPDAATQAMIAVEIDGKGRVTVEGVGTCDEEGPQNGSCMFVVTMTAPTTVYANGYPDWSFDRWTTAACAVVPEASCSFTPTGPTQVGVKFRREDDD